MLVKGNVANLFSHYRPARKVFVDTSVLMDGRILAAAQTGFLSDDLIIPRSVIRELQLLADGKDAAKRARARFGLDIVSALERIDFFDVAILPDRLDHTPVDERLLELAKSEHGMIMTLDYNLSKVAATEKIPILNLNELTLALQHEHLAGERLKLKITSPGSNNRQGIGHSRDGIMVVVEDAKNKVGKEVEVEFTHFLQTPSGRMAFAKLVKPTSKAKTRR